MHTRKIALALTVLLLATLACTMFGVDVVEETAPDGESIPSGVPDSASPTPGTDAVPPEASSGGEDSSSGEGSSGSTGEPGGSQPQAGEPLDLGDPALYVQPELFDYYKTSMYYYFETEGPITGTVYLTSATEVDPYATTMQFETGGNAVLGNQGTYTFTQVAGVQYSVLPVLGCQAGTPAGQDNPYEAMMDTGGMLTGEAQYSGEETVNGVDAYRYDITMDNINPLDPAGLGVREISNGRLFIAREGGYLVRLLLEGRGINEVLSQSGSIEGDIYYEVNFYDFDVPVTVEIPPACTSETGSDIPLLPDADNVSKFGDLVSYTTGESVGDVIEFYETEMPAFGCAPPQVVGSDDTGSASMMFTGCEFGSMQILALEETSDITQVSIIKIP